MPATVLLTDQKLACILLVGHDLQLSFPITALSFRPRVQTNTLGVHTCATVANQSMLKSPLAWLLASHGASLWLPLQIGLGYTTSGTVHNASGKQPRLTPMLGKNNCMTSLNW